MTADNRALNYFLRTGFYFVGVIRILVRRIRRQRMRIMIYKSQEDKIGDMILMTGVVPHYRRLFSDATLEMVCNDESVAMMQATGVFDAVWPRSLLSSKGRPRWTNAGRVDLFISLRRTVAPSDAMWMDSFRPVRAFGFLGDLLRHCVSILPRYRKKLDEICELPDDRGESNLHELDVQRKMLSQLGIDFPVESLCPRIPEAYSDSSVAETVECVYNLADKPFYICCPCGSQPIRSYGAENWHPVFAALAPCVVAVCATGKDWREVLELTAKPIEGVIFINLAGQTTLQELSGLFQRADAVLAVESGPMHLAVAMERPLVAVCGRGHYGRFVPYPYAISNAEFLFSDCEHSGCAWKCLFPRTVCITNIEPAEVVAAVRRVSRSDVV